MKTVTSKEGYKKLVKEIKAHDRRYYQESAPTISDYEYDLLVKELERVEALHPDWVESSSPTKSISTDTSGHFTTAKHRIPMLSLANTYSKEEVEAFIHRMEKLTEQKDIPFNVELKMDGVALSVIYEGGKLVQAVTRGNGAQGDDVTQNAAGIKNLPQMINSKDRMEMRGEVYLPLSEFRRLNKEREESGLEVYANPRNAASGSLKLIDAEVSKKRGLMIMLYDLVNPPASISHQSQIAPFLKKSGLPVFDKEFTHSAVSAEEILSFASIIEKKRSSLPFEIDGIVVKVDNLDVRADLGATNKSPRWAMAYKFAAEQAETVIESISVQVGRTGVLTPVANLTPVLLSGSTISRATLHNQDEIDRKDIREGDRVIIEKGGDVIPKVVSVIQTSKKRAPKWKMPTSCPHCAGPVEHKEGEVAVRCKAGVKCTGQYLARLKHFVSKGAMNIENFGVKVIERFYSLGLLETLPDIYRLEQEDLEELEGFGDRSIEVLLGNIEKSKEPELFRFIFALGIPFVGVVAAKTIAEYVKDMDTFLSVEEEELIALEGIGEKVAGAIVEYLEDSHHLEEIEDLLELGIAPKAPAKKQSGHLFSGKTFVMTGTLDGYSRSEAKEIIEGRGGKVTSSISKITDYLLLGKNPGSKYNKAIKLKVEILPEEDFKELI
ncbi:NAD-dependent DNA ligase LigA [bacterium]|nr:NAD-dependent DNA ligase LigA [bacterium]